MKKILLLILVPITFCKAQIPSSIPTNGLVGWYPFNNNANDLTSNANNGNVSGAILTNDRFGNPNAAYDFDGIDDFISVSNAVGLNNNNYTISIWLKCEGLPGIGDSDVFFDLGSGSWPNYGAIFAINNNYQNTTGWRVTCGNSSGGSVGFQNNVLPNSNQWYNFIITRSDSVKLFVNGMLIQKMTTANNFQYYSNPVSISIGKRIGMDHYFDGIIDDIGIWNRVLSPSEILTIYQSNNVSVKEENYINESITVYPVPAKDELNIKIKNPSKDAKYFVSLTNIYGQIVLSKNIENDVDDFKIEIPESFSKGMYFVTILDTKKSKIIDSKKIIIE